MFLNLLLTDPDNVHGNYIGIGKASELPYYILAITAIAIIVTIVAACIINYLYKNSKAAENKETGAITTIIISVSLAICLVLILLCVFACMKI